MAACESIDLPDDDVTGIESGSAKRAGAALLFDGLRAREASFNARTDVAVSDRGIVLLDAIKGLGACPCAINQSASCGMSGLPLSSVMRLRRPVSTSSNETARQGLTAHASTSSSNTLHPRHAHGTQADPFPSADQSAPTASRATNQNHMSLCGTSATGISVIGLSRSDANPNHATRTQAASGQPVFGMRKTIHQIALLEFSI